MNSLPRWDLSNVYPGVESTEFAAAMTDIKQQIESLEQFLTSTISTISALSPTQSVGESAELGAPLAESIERFNTLNRLESTVHAYLYSFVSTDSHNTVARKKMSEFNQLQVPSQMVYTQWQMWVGQLGAALEQAIASNATVQAHAFYLREMAEQAKYLMSEAEEALAADLSVSGAKGWEQLQRTVTSQLMVDFELDGKLQKLPMTVIINLRTHADEDVRRRAYEAENGAWAEVREPLAASLNGIKGTMSTLNRRRGREDALHASIDAARLDRPTLEAMLGAMEASLPMFRRYFKAKARHLGKEQLAWWDLFAPVGKSDKRYSWQETRSFILENFGKFSEEMADFAQRTFDEPWIDAEPRAGKVGGAFCMSLPAVQESRVLLSFDGSLTKVSTVAHELGHAYHNECHYAAGKTILQSSTPMTLAETASIMCETIATQAVLEQAQDVQEELAILEEILNGASQVIVDIYSRYLFEQEVFEQRAKSELSADDFCEIMERAQKATYGDGLDPQYLQKYMWTWKPHYYSADLSFYNYPYAFGLLFSTGLYAIYQQRGEEFVSDYQQLLASTGEANAADLAARFGIDLRSRSFWEESLGVIEKQIDRYCAI